MNAESKLNEPSRIGTDSRSSGWSVLFQTLLSVGLFLSDIAAILATSCLSGIVYHLAAYGHPGSIMQFLQIGSVAAAMFSIASLVRGEYTGARLPSYRPRLFQTLHLWNLAFVSLLLIGFVSKTGAEHSRGAVLLFYAATLPVLIMLRLFMARVIAAAGRAGLLGARRIFLFGTGTGIFDFMRSYGQKTSGIVVVGCRFVTPVEPDAEQDARRASLAIDLDAAVSSARELAPESIVLMLPWSQSEAIEMCVERLLALPTEVHLGPDRILQKYNELHVSRFGALASFRIKRVPLTRIELAMKRGFDLVVASIALVALAPLLALTALLIKLDSPGPVLFLQQRIGFNQRPFRIFKFRTMTTLDDGDIIPQAAPDDPRVTRVGRWLRRWNIDEVPQLINVIKGDMSLVGPRPHAVSHDREYQSRIAVYARRHNVKPGITGWAQVHGFRGETRSPGKIEQRVAHDLYYIENWSLTLDVRILFRTVVSASAFRNAY